jgi:hypothetical protein
MKNLALEKNSRIKLIVLENNRFIIRHYEISFSMVSNREEGELDLEKIQLDHNIGFAKAMCFIDAILNDSIVLTPDLLSVYERTLCEFDNNFILVPDTSDVTLINVIQRKLSAVVGDSSEVNNVVLYDVDDQLKYRLDVFEQDDNDMDLPSIREFIGDLHINKFPWWDRHDETTWDGAAKTQEEYDALRNNEVDDAPSLFEEIEESIRTLYSTATNAGEIIEVDFSEEHKKKIKKWKPTVI